MKGLGLFGYLNNINMKSYNIKDWKKVAIPKAMKYLPKDKRGYPIPFTVLVDDKGTPHFRVNDSEKTIKCLLNKRCSISGRSYGEQGWLVGGILSAFHPKGAYFDIPVREDCGVYAMKVCPNFAAPNYTSKQKEEAINKIQSKTFNTFIDPTTISKRPSCFVMVLPSKIMINPATMNIIAERPYKKVRFFLEGNELNELEFFEIVEKDPDLILVSKSPIIIHQSNNIK